MQTAVIIGLLGCSLQLPPRDHSAAEARRRKWIEGYIPVGTLVLNRQTQPGEPVAGVIYNRRAT